MHLRLPGTSHCCDICTLLFIDAHCIVFLSGSYEAIETISDHGEGESAADAFIWGRLLFPPLLTKPVCLPNGQKPIVLQYEMFFCFCVLPYHSIHA